MAVSTQWVAGEVKHSYVNVIKTVDSQHGMTHLVQLLNFFNSWAAIQC